MSKEMIIFCIYIVLVVVVIVFEIYSMSDTIKHELSLLADEIISRKNENRYDNTLDLETQINEIVYKLFGFSGKEIELIKLTGKEK